MAEENNFPSDVSTDNKSFIGASRRQLTEGDIEPSHFSIEETNRHNSLEVETGFGSNQVFYPPAIHTATHVPSQNTLGRQHVTDTSGVQQTAKARTASESSGSHSPCEVNSPCGSPEIVTSGSFLNKRNVPENPIQNNNRTAVTGIMHYSNGPVQMQYSCKHVRDEKATFDNVLRKPDCLIYARSGGPFIDAIKVKYPEFKNEATRVRSFRFWPLNQPTRQDLAATFLFYKGVVNHDGIEEKDMVFCYRCGGTLFRFEPGDNPDEEHRKHYPHCFETIWDC